MSSDGWTTISPHADVYYQAAGRTILKSRRRQMLKLLTAYQSTVKGKLGSSKSVRAASDSDEDGEQWVRVHTD